MPVNCRSALTKPLSCQIASTPPLAATRDIFLRATLGTMGTNVAHEPSGCCLTARDLGWHLEDQIPASQAENHIGSPGRKHRGQLAYVSHGLRQARDHDVKQSD